MQLFRVIRLEKILYVFLKKCVCVCVGGGGWFEPSTPYPSARQWLLRYAFDLTDYLASTDALTSYTALYKTTLAIQ